MVKNERVGRGGDASSQVYILHSLASADSITALNALQTLLECGKVNVNQREYDGLTALHVAAAWDHLATCYVLLYHGADPFQTDIHGRTAYDLAVGRTKEFFARTFRGFDGDSKKKKNSSNRSSRIGFLKALTRLFACASSSSSSSSSSSHSQHRNSLTTNVRHSWSNLHRKHATDDDINRVARISTASIQQPTQQQGNNSTVSSLQANTNTNMNMNRSQSETNLPTTKQSHHQKDYQVLDKGKANPPCYNGDMGAAIADDTFLTALSDLDNGTSKRFNDYAKISPPKIYVTDDDSSAHEEEITEEDEKQIPEDVLRMVKGLPDRSLRQEFESRGVMIGPVTQSTRKAYELKLARLLSRMTSLNADEDNEKRFSVVLERVIAGMSCEAGRKMDEIIVNEFFCSENWRQGVKATSFCYILMDPSQVDNNRHSSCTFVQFLRAIFYIGKGKRSRPLQHLHDAVKAKMGGIGASPVQMTDKLRRILDIWAKGYGVVSLHVFQNTIPVEALTREAAMIDAIGLGNLTNAKKGDYYGVSKEWTLKERTLYGSYLLKKALEVFRVEGCRQLFENDVRET